MLYSVMTLLGRLYVLIVKIVFILLRLQNQNMNCKIFVKTPAYSCLSVDAGKINFSFPLSLFVSMSVCPCVHEWTYTYAMQSNLNNLWMPSSRVVEKVSQTLYFFSRVIF